MDHTRQCWGILPGHAQGNHMWCQGSNQGFARQVPYHLYHLSDPLPFFESCLFMSMPSIVRCNQLKELHKSSHHGKVHLALPEAPAFERQTRSKQCLGAKRDLVSTAVIASCQAICELCVLQDVRVSHEDFAYSLHSYLLIIHLFYFGAHTQLFSGLTPVFVLGDHSYWAQKLLDASTLATCKASALAVILLLHPFCTRTFNPWAIFQLFGQDWSQAWRLTELSSFIKDIVK